MMFGQMEGRLAPLAQYIACRALGGPDSLGLALVCLVRVNFLVAGQRRAGADS